MDDHVCEGDVRLHYVGDRYIPGVPAADHTVPCAVSHGLIESGLYVRDDADPEPNELEEAKPEHPDGE